MKTIELPKFGNADVMTQGKRAIPVPSEHEVLIKTAAAGVNGPDLLQRRGHYPPPAGASDLLGLEVSGTIASVGSGVSQWKVGAQVCALTNGGGYAEYVSVNAAHCLPVPKNVSLTDAAGLCETFFTVWSNLYLNARIRKGTLLLVHGGAGGIGSTAIQLGKAMGQRVFTTCNSAEDHSYVQRLGADQSIDYEAEDFVEVVRAAGGADLIVDIVGGDYISRNIKAANTDGKIVQLAFNKGSKVDINLMSIMLKRLVYTGSTLRSRPDDFKAAVAADLQKAVWPFFANGRLKPQTHAVFPFSQVQDAHRMMEAGDHRGKILLTQT